MGKNSDYYTKDLYKQMTQRINSMKVYNQSKHTDKLNGVDRSSIIYANKTHDNIKIHSRLFADWCKQNHPNATLKSAARYVPEYLQHCADKGLATGTLKTYRASLNKVFKIKDGSRYYKELPNLKRSEFTRSRGEKPSDKRFNPENHKELVMFAKATGGRRNDIQHVKKDNLYCRTYLEQHKNEGTKFEQKMIQETLKAFPNHEYFVKFECSKGGRDRYAPIDKPYVEQVLPLFRGNANDRVFAEKIPKSADIHSYRAEYANSLYNQIARPINEIPFDKVNHGSGHRYQSQVYHCRGDMRGVAFDRLALGPVAIALGHGEQRAEIFVDNYYRA